MLRTLYVVLALAAFPLCADTSETDDPLVDKNLTWFFHKKEAPPESRCEPTEPPPESRCELIEPPPASCCEPIEPHRCGDPPFFLEVKGSAFFPRNSLIREIYSKTIGAVGAEISWREWKQLYAWVSGNYSHSSGHSIGNGDPTEVTVVPIGLGLKYLCDFKNFGVYAGVGALYSYLHMRDHSPYVFPSTTKWDWGATAKIGLIVFLKHQFFIDVFSDYCFMKFYIPNTTTRVVRNDIDFSGFSLGASIGWAL